ncbi:MAG: hypothetical protein JST75_09330 [Bacteroidetes bacterium]|nr:hypothetical protein [Bacteroidota bacterium]
MKKIQTMYDRVQQVRLDQPIQFMLICKLLQTEPMKILHDFMVNSSGDSWRRSDDDEQRSKAVEYFIQCGYGQHYYSEQDIRRMFEELHAIGSLWPETDEESVIDMHAKWREKYYQYWFNKWNGKIRRKM